jgi:hemerythrin
METPLHEKFLLHIPSIDKQHQRFLNILQQLTLQEAPKEHEQLNVIINELDDYIKLHFRFEEALMKKAGYVDLDEHIEQHRFFEKEIQELRIEYNYMNPVLFEKMVIFIKKWFLDHILNTDKKYQQTIDDYFKAKKQ